MQDHNPDQDKDVRGQGSAIRELLFVACSIAIGLIASYYLLKGVFIPSVGFPGDLERITKLDDRLVFAAEDKKRVEIISNSVGVEGIIASVVGQELGDACLVRNQAANGIDVLSGRLYISRVLASDPDVLIWIIRPEMLGELRPVNAQLASVMRWAGYEEHATWVSAEGADYGLSEGTLERLAASERENLISFRTLPLSMLNESARAMMRDGILMAKPLDTEAPYQIDVQLRGDRLQRHIRDVTVSYEDRIGDGSGRGAEIIERTLRQIRDAEVVPVVVLAPTHPDASEIVQQSDAFRDAVTGISTRTGAIMIDLTGSLSADEFADAIHPNRQGARTLSEQLGAALRNQLNAREQE